MGAVVQGHKGFNVELDLRVVAETADISVSRGFLAGVADVFQVQIMDIGDHHIDWDDIAENYVLSDKLEKTDIHELLGTDEREIVESRSILD